MRILIVSVLALLSACATCQQHKVACTVGAVIVTGAVVAIATSKSNAGNADPNYRVAHEH